MIGGRLCHPWSKRGLQPVVRVVEPQVVGLAPQTVTERGADTMTRDLPNSSPRRRAESRKADGHRGAPESKSQAGFSETKTPGQLERAGHLGA
jgi:hypothetical protein